MAQRNIIFMSGGHTQLARVNAWLGTSGVKKPVFAKAASQCFSVADNDERRFHEGDWKKIDQATEFLKQQKGKAKPFFLYVSTGLVHAAFRTGKIMANCFSGYNRDDEEIVNKWLADE